MFPELSRRNPVQSSRFTKLKNGAVRLNRGMDVVAKRVSSLQQKTHPLVRKGAGAFDKFANVKYIGGPLMAADFLLTGYMTDATYDPTTHDNRVNEFGKNFIAHNLVEAAGLGVAGGIGMAAKKFKSPKLAAIGMGIGAASMALSLAGFGPGEFVKRKMDTMGREFDNERYGRGPIKQNEQTLRATSQNMSLLGQAGFGGNEVINPQSFAARQRGLLGSEAMLMHN